MATVQIPLALDLATLERVVIRPEPGFTDDDFFDFCQEHQLLRIERNSDGEIIIMAPTGFESGFIELEIAAALREWANRDGRGVAVGSNAGLKLPDGSTLSPDASWSPKDQVRAVPRRLRKKFPPLVPVFVIEIRSPSDRKKDLHEKMLAYLRNGVELGWVIDPESRTVSIYKPNQEPITLEDPHRVEGEGPVAGFILDLKSIYQQLED